MFSWNPCCGYKHFYIIKHFLLFLFCPAVSTADDVLLAVHPYQTSSTIIKAFTPLVDYLGRELAMKVNLDVSPNYDAHIARIGKNQVDIAYLGPGHSG